MKRQAKAAQIAEQQEAQKKLQDVTEFLTAELAKDPISTDPSKREEIFTSSLEQGERLSMAGDQDLLAASKFYRALTVYPNPAELLEIYQKSIAKNVYENIVLMIAILPPANVSNFLSGVTSKMDKLQMESETMEKMNEIDE